MRGRADEGIVLSRSISRAREDGAKIDVMRMKSAHMPMLKDPEGLAGCIEKMVEGL